MNVFGPLFRGFGVVLYNTFREQNTIMYIVLFRFTIYEVLTFYISFYKKNEREGYCPSHERFVHELFYYLLLK